MTMPDYKNKHGTKFVRKGDYGSIYGDLYNDFPQESIRAGTMPLSLIRVKQSSHETKDPAIDDLVFRLVINSEMNHSSVDCGNGRKILSGRKGSFYLAPDSAEAYWRSQGDHELLMLAISKAKVDQIMAIDDKPLSDTLEALYNRDIYNGTVPNLINRIWEHSVFDGPGASLLVDGLFLTLLGTLSNLSKSVTGERVRGDVLPLDKKSILEITDYIDANLEERVSLETLASLVGFSVFHFARCFKLATNTTPHMFLTSRRVQASRRMLADPERSLADIAYACGFSSQAYFTTKFKEYTGFTPGVYRSNFNS